MNRLYISSSYFGLLALLLCLVATKTSASSVPELMKAVVQPVPLGSLEIGTVPVPTLKEREILIKVNYAALNRMDLLQVKGLYPLPPGTPDILGVEVSGTIATIGPNVTSDLAVGDSVMALLLGGGYAEYAAADERTVMKLIPGMNLKQSAAIPEAFMTAYQLLFWVGKLQRGNTVLMHAAASSIGQAAIQLAASHGINVIATARSQSKVDLCIAIGASNGVVVGSDATFSAKVRELNGDRGVDAVLDPVGQAYLSENVDVLDYDGKLVMYGLLSGPKVEDPQFLKKLLFKRANLLPSTLRARDIEYKASLIHELLTDTNALPAVARSEIAVDISAEFPMEQVLEAHAMMAKNENAGKILLVVAPEGQTETKAEL